MELVTVPSQLIMSYRLQKRGFNNFVIVIPKEGLAGVTCLSLFLVRMMTIRKPSKTAFSGNPKGSGLFFATMANMSFSRVIFLIPWKFENCYTQKSSLLYVKKWRNELVNLVPSWRHNLADLGTSTKEQPCWPWYQHEGTTLLTLVPAWRHDLADLGTSMKAQPCWPWYQHEGTTLLTLVPAWRHNLGALGASMKAECCVPPHSNSEVIIHCN